MKKEREARELHTERSAKGTARRGRKLKIALLSVFGCLILTAGILYLLNDWVITVTMNGDDTQVMEAGDTYKEAGATAICKGSIFTFIEDEVEVTAKGAVDNMRPGAYTVTYGASLRGSTGTAERTVEVVDTTPPELTLLHIGSTYTLPGKPYQEEGFQAHDLVDGNIAYRVRSQERDGIIFYEVSDRAGNITMASRPVFYDDRTAPVITLGGGDTVVVGVGASYSDDFSAIDDADGDITSKVLVDGAVDTSTPGTYTITYLARDEHGNETTVSRTVVVKPQTREEDGNKLIYLTFDDGPGPYTDRLLGILDKYGIKVTFFVTNTHPGYQNYIGIEAQRGHTVALHTYCHDYGTIYASEDAFWNDFESMQSIIQAQTGSRVNIFRFPGGSSNMVSAKYNEGIMSRLTQQAMAKGYTYVDWNVSSGDAGGTTDPKEVAANIIDGVQKHNTSVVLCHDIHEYTVDAMEEFITWALDNGYHFAPMTESSFAPHHSVNN